MKVVAKKGRGPSTPIQLPRDWERAIREFLWGKYLKEHAASLRGTDEIEHFKQCFGFPSPNTLKNAMKHNCMTASVLHKIARKAKMFDSELEEGIWEHSAYPEERVETGTTSACASKAAPDAAVATGRDPAHDDLQVFLHRKELMANSEIMRVLDTCRSLDMVALSAAIANNIFGLNLRAALARDDFNCRFVIFDPSPATAAHYDPFVTRVLDESPVIKREQAKELLALAVARSNLQLRVIRDLPLIHSLWVAQDHEGTDYMAHLSVFMYESLLGGPAFRVRRGHPFVQRVRQEFEYVWEYVAVPFDSALRSKAPSEVVSPPTKSSAKTKARKRA